MKFFAAAALTLTFSLLAVPAGAASFDCARASTRIEKAICGDEELSALDELLGDRYVRALKKGEDPKAIKAAQRAWLRELRNACPNAACLKAAYEARIAELTKIDWMTDEKAKAICERVAAAKVDGSYNAAFHKVAADTTAFVDPAPGLWGYSFRHPLNIDYDSDGKVEKLASIGQYGGTCQLYSVSMIVDVTHGTPERMPSNDWGWQAGHQVFLVVDGEPVLARTPNEPKSVLTLDWLTPAGTSMPLCNIAIKRERHLETVEAVDPALCRAVADNKVEFIPWKPAPEEVRRKSEAAEMPGTSISSVSLDIDTDGTEDTVAWVYYPSSAGCGYDHHWLVEMSRDLMSVSRSPLNSLLIDKGPRVGAAGRWREWAPAPGSPRKGWDKPRIFRFDGRPYILGRANVNEIDTANVVSMWAGEEKSWCKYQYPALPVGADVRYFPIKSPSADLSGGVQ